MTTFNREEAAKYNYIIGLDASYSMSEPSTRYPGKTRWTEAQETILGLSREVHEFDTDGIDVVVFGGNVQVHNNVTPNKVAEVFASRGPRGNTPLAEALQKIVEKRSESGKPTVALIFTDGEPNDKMAVAKVIIDATKQMEANDELTFCFIQIGNDAGAARFLQTLDDDLKSHGAKFDIVDAISANDAENMSALELIAKAIAD